MKVIICDNKKEVAIEFSRIVANEIKRKPNLVLGLATGRTVIPLYKELVKLYKKDKIDFSKVRTFNLDEYVNLPVSDKGSFRKFMEKYLFSKINLKKENIHFLDGNVKIFKKEAQRYENEIKKVGGIDLQVLGIGRNGHVGFNEPGSKINSLTRIVKLSENTWKVNSSFFTFKKVPKTALTMGIRTILKADKIVIIATGKEKSEIIGELINSKIDEELPASFLKMHKNFIILLDKNASKKIK